MVEIADIDRKIRLAKRNVNGCHPPGARRQEMKNVLDILGDMQKILEEQDEAIRMKEPIHARPQSS